APSACTPSPCAGADRDRCRTASGPPCTARRGGGRCAPGWRRGLLRAFRGPWLDGTAQRHHTLYVRCFRGQDVQRAVFLLAFAAMAPLLGGCLDGGGAGPGLDPFAVHAAALQEGRFYAFQHRGGGLVFAVPGAASARSASRPAPRPTPPWISTSCAPRRPCTCRSSGVSRASTSASTAWRVPCSRRSRQAASPPCWGASSRSAPRTTARTCATAT